MQICRFITSDMISLGVLVGKRGVSRSKQVFLLLLLASITVAGCTWLSPTTTNAQGSDQDEEAARQTLEDFFRQLSSGDYQRAASLYAGSYDWLIDNNPGVSPDDHATLLENGCRYNGLQCLESSAILPDTTSSDMGYSFLVAFRAPDGSLFVQGPCCGTTETEQPPVSQFQYHVKRFDDGSFGVLELPPYVP